MDGLRRSLAAIRARQPFAFGLSVHLIFFVPVMYVSFLRNSGSLFQGLDGSFTLTLVRDQMMWAPSYLGQTWNPMQSLGNVWFPLTARLFPGYLIPVALFGAAAVSLAKFQALSYTIFATELFLATAIAGRAIGFAAAPSIAAAWLTSLLLFPVMGEPPLYPILVLVPQFAATMTGLLLLIALFACLGRSGDRRIDVLIVLAALLIMGHMILSAPAAILLFAPVLGMAVVGLMAGVETRAEAVMKVSAVLAIIVILSIAGFLSFQIGVFAHTATYFWPREFEQFRPTANGLYSLSIALQGNVHGYAGAVVYAVAIPGLVHCMRTAERRLARYAAAIFCSVAVLLGFGVLTLLADFWRGPLPVYFDIILVPMYALFAARFIAIVICRLADRLAPHAAPRAGWIANTITAAGVIAFLVIALSSPRQARRYPFPPVRTPLIAALANALALAPGAPFRGRVAVFPAQNVPDNLGWMAIHTIDSARVAASGNDHHMTGLWYYGIPTLFEYNSLMSPAFFRAATRLFVRPGDRPLRNTLVLRRIAPHALAVLGVSHVLTDQPQAAPLRHVASEQVAPGETLHLYEVPAPSLGKWSVVELRTVNSFDAALDAIADPKFDSSRTGVVIGATGAPRVPDNLVAADEISLHVVAGGLQVAARSAGTSLVVLPFEFSHCLTLAGSAGQAKLLRINALETGLLFSGAIAAGIRYFSGPFTNRDCRIRDAAEFSALIGSPGAGAESP